MSTTEETVTCSNCGAEIAKSKAFLHESYCFKNLYRCRCGAVIEKKAREQHEEEVHVTVDCPHCGQKMEKGKLAEHEEVCPKRSRICPYCKSKITGTNFASHVELCGNRTILCPRCKQKVPMKDWEQHQLSPCLPSGEEPPKLFDEPSQRIPAKPAPPVPGTLPPISSILPKGPTERKTQEERDREIAEAMAFEAEEAKEEYSPPPPEYKTEQLLPPAPEYGMGGRGFPPSTSLLEEMMRPGHGLGPGMGFGARPPQPERRTTEDEEIQRAIEASLREHPKEEHKEAGGIEEMASADPMMSEEMQKAIQESLMGSKKPPK